VFVRIDPNETEDREGDSLVVIGLDVDMLVGERVEKIESIYEVARSRHHLSVSIRRVVEDGENTH